MWRRMLAITAAVCLMASASLAFAQADSPYKRSKNVDFTKGDTISGDLVTPGGGWVDAPSAIKFESLIDYRYNFVPEMIATTEDI